VIGLGLLWPGAWAQSPASPAASSETEHADAADPVDQLRAWLADEQRPALGTEAFARAPLTKEQAAEAGALLWERRKGELERERRAEWDAREISLDGRVMQFEFRVFGEKPAGGRRLFLSMHGGGNTTAKVNEQQWRNQIRLYEPAEGVYLAPRAPTDSWNLWHEAHIDGMFDRIIEDAIVFEGVDPDRVYLLGYSAGGDGVYQLAPRMADRWAAASMMAGHPNDASPLNLRNVPFAIHVGEKDDAYGRSRVAREWGEKLDALAAADAGPAPAYVHVVRLHAGLGHWMNREDAEALGWMSGFTRDPAPPRVVWRVGAPRGGADAARGRRMYWIRLDDTAVPAGTVIEAHLVNDAKGQRVEIDRLERAPTPAAAAGSGDAGVAGAGASRVTFLLRDGVFDLDRAVRVEGGGRVLFEGAVSRTVAALEASLGPRGDPSRLFAGEVTVEIPAGP
jgi:poly(3-hydroxybutyrate) depolymerase